MVSVRTLSEAIVRQLAPHLPPGLVLRLGDDDEGEVVLTGPWPPVAGSKLGELAQPHASVRNAILCLWYGDEEQPALPMISVGLSG